jgi:hypothetical protein
MAKSPKKSPKAKLTASQRKAEAKRALTDSEKERLHAKNKTASLPTTAEAKKKLAETNNLDAKLKAQTAGMTYANKFAWYNREYSARWNLEPKLGKLAGYKIDHTIGAAGRFQNIQWTKYAFTYNTMDTIVIVMKLHSGSQKLETNYGVLFGEILENIPKLQRASIDQAASGIVGFTFYSASPSYVSCDGEYRSRFSRYGSLLLAKDNYPGLWNELEEYILRVKTRRQWSFYTSYFYPKLEEEKQSLAIESAVRSQFAPVTILVITWFHTIFEAMLGLTKTHVNDTFKKIFLQHEAEDITFLKEVIEKFGAEMIEEFKLAVSTSRRSAFSGNAHVHCGYKMIPLNYREVQDPMNMRYKPWREYFISAKCGDLVINHIAPGFPVLLDWFYIKNSRKGLYDNKSQYERMKNSELAKEIAHILFEAQRNTYFAAENITEIPKTSKDVKKWISSKFKKLSVKIEDALDYSTEDIIMSEVTLAFATEHIGRTVADVLVLLTASKTFSRMLGDPLRDAGYDHFAKYMFDICYSLYCANSKLGLIHGDLHLNNATIGAFYTPRPEDTKNAKTWRTIYRLDDEHQYVFPNNGYYGALIDFSRGIINYEKLEVFRDQSLPATQRVVKDETQFRLMESHALLSLYLQMFPGKLRQREELVVLFKNHFQAVFRLLTCIDLYMFSIRMVRGLAQIKAPVGKRATALVQKINRKAEQYVASEMNHLLAETEPYAKIVEERPWPIATIIHECFAEYNGGECLKGPGAISDVYNYENELTDSLAKFDTFPTMFKESKFIDDDGKVHTVTAAERARKEHRGEYERIKEENLAMVHYIASRHSQKLF